MSRGKPISHYSSRELAGSLEFAADLIDPKRSTEVFRLVDEVIRRFRAGSFGPVGIGRPKLTERQQQAYEFILDRFYRDCRPPSPAELAVHLGIGVPGAHAMIRRLEDRGYLLVGGSVYSGGFVGGTPESPSASDFTDALLEDIARDVIHSAPPRAPREPHD